MFTATTLSRVGRGRSGPVPSGVGVGKSGSSEGADPEGGWVPAGLSVVSADVGPAAGDPGSATHPASISTATAPATRQCGRPRNSISTPPLTTRRHQEDRRYPTRAALAVVP